MTQAQMAALGKVAERSQGNYERNERVPDAEYLAEIATVVDLGYLLRGASAQELAEPPAPYERGPPAPDLEGFVFIPRYEAEASAGGGAFAQDTEPAERLAFKEEWVRRVLGARVKDLVLLSCRGDSMAPTLADGDLLLVDTARRALREPGIYVLRLAGALVAKRVARHADGAVTLIPDNEAYPRETLGPDRAEELAAIGRVVWVGRKL